MSARKPLIKHKQIARRGRLMNMLYKPKEIAEELGIHVDTIYRSYIPAGLPYFRNKQGIWIHGTTFVDWSKQTIIQNKKHHHLQENQVWCLRCKKPVEDINTVVIYTKGNAELHQSHCPECGIKINRMRSKGGAK